MTPAPSVTASQRPLRLAWAVGTLAVLLVLLAPRLAAAQSKSDAFAGKIPPVSAGLYRKAGRWEGSLTGNLSVNDPFFSKYFAGVKLGYHFTETLSLHGLFATGLVTKSGSAQVCPSGSGCQSASTAEMYQVPGHINWMSGVEGAWSPVYGKLDFFSEQVGHFDLSLLAGVDWINYRKVLSSTDVAGGETPPAASTLGGHLGVGARFFFSEWIAARLEFKDYVYQVRVPNWQEGGGAKKDLQHQLFTEVGISFFFPLNNRPLQ